MYCSAPNHDDLISFVEKYPHNEFGFPEFHEKSLECKQSNIINAGLGVFAKEPIKRGEIICDYMGYIKPCNECDAEETKYSISVGYDMCIVGDDIGAKINDIVDFRELSESEAQKLYEGEPPISKHTTEHNAAYIIVGLGTFARVYIVAINDIEPGSELYVSYGAPYWICQYKNSGYIEPLIAEKLDEELREKNLKKLRQKYNVELEK